MTKTNLNTLTTEVDPTWLPCRPWAARSKGSREQPANVEVIFDEIETRLIQLVQQAEVVVGCIAWLTNKPLLRALATRPASLLIQKEDFLRHDSDACGNSQRELRKLYEGYGDRLDLSGRYLREIDRFDVGGMLCSLNDTGEGGPLPRVRCVGVAAGRKDIPPRMHHKFAVFCKMGPPQPSEPERHLKPGETGFGFGEFRPNEYAAWKEAQRVWEEAHGPLGRLKPYAVATGSFNWTHNGTQSFENVVVLHSSEIASAYAMEWLHLLSLSESLDWTSKYVEPDWRVGS